MRVGLGHSRQTEALPTLAGMSALPPKANFPILELLPSPALSERRHRGLARRLVAVRRRAVLMVAKGERPHPRRTREAATSRLWRLVADPPTLPNVLIFSAAMGAVQWQTSRMTHPVRFRRNPVI